MKKRLLLIALVIILSTTPVMQTEMHAEAAATTAVSSYTASKVLAALLALVGVVVEKSGIQLIWNGQGLNTDALINNMMVYDRYLGMQMKVLLANGAAGITTLTLNRRLWTSFKEWARSYFGVSIGTDNIFGTSDTTTEIIRAGTPLNVNMSYTLNNKIYESSYNITFNQDVIGFLLYYQEDGFLYPWRYELRFYPVEYDASLPLTNTVENISGTSVSAGGGTVGSGENSGLYQQFGFNNNYNFGAFALSVVCYAVGKYASTTAATIRTKLSEFRQGNALVQEEDVTAAPIQGVGENAATAEGQDVIGFGNTATQEGNEVVIDGPLDIALPAEDDLESLLADLAAGLITYQEYVEALGLAAVNTKTESLTQVQEKEQAITTNPIAGSYTVQLNDLFPFCIPFDLYEIIECFKADPVAPSAEITIPTGYDGTEFTWNTYTVSLDAFSPVAAVVRVLEYVGFVMALMFVTRKLIEG